jgi:apolipoprotein N-acyltransferase
VSPFLEGVQVAVRRRFIISKRTSRVAFLASLGISACLMGVSISWHGYWWVGWFTLLPLFHAIRVLAPRAAFGAGALWGCCLVAFTFAIGRPVASDVELLLLLGAVPGAYTYFGARLTRHIGFSPYLLALGWIGVEFALEPLGLRYGLLSGTQTQGAIGFLGSFTGYALVAFVVAYINASLLSVLVDVRALIVQPRLVARSSTAQRRILPYDLPSYLSHLFRPARPRAPPA